MRSHTASRLGLMLALGAVGCDDGDTGPSDTVPPEVTLTAPGEFATVQGTVTVIASATDDDGVAGVRFFVDGAPIGAEDGDPPFAVLWNTVDSDDGNHTLTAQARDRAGLTAMSAGVPVSVLNGPASIELTVTISGPGVDPDGFRILVNDMVMGSLEGAGSVTLGGLPAGDHRITLEGLSLWCDPVGAIGVTLATATTTPVTIPIHCSAGPGGRLIVVGRTEDGVEVARLPIATGIAERIFHGPGSADVSPDGTQLALIASRVLLISGVDLSDQVPVANLPFGASHPRWSPDGAVILFHAGAGVNDLYLIDPDGSDLRRFFAEESLRNRAFADWSPDGRIAYVEYDFAEGEVPVGGSIWIAAGDGSDAAYFADGHSPAWSPDGTELALARVAQPADEASPSSIRLASADGTAERTLTAGFQDDFPVWAPDGSWLAVARVIEPGTRELWVVRASDGVDRRLHDSYQQVRASGWIPGD